MGFVLRGGLIWDGLAAEPQVADLRIDDRVTGIYPPGQVPRSAIEDDDVTVELDDAFVLPGLIDSHVHLVWSGGPDPASDVDREGEQLTVVRAVANARSQLAAGITTVRDLGSNWDVAITLARAVDRNICEGPTVVAAGRTVIMTGGHDPFWGIFSDGVDAVTSAVRRQVSIGAEVIKTAATGGAYGRSEGEEIGQAELSFEELSAIASEAHRFGRKVAAHALGNEGIRNAVLAGIDTIEHGVFLDEETVAAMRERGTVLCPTLATYRTLAEGDGIPAYAVDKARRAVAAHRESFAMALSAGIPVIAGTDAGAPNLPHPSLVDELEVLHEYGMPVVDALKAATSDAAAAMGHQDRAGQIRVQAPADLVVVEDDPFADLGNLRKVWGVIRSGRPLANRSPFHRHPSALTVEAAS